MINKTQEQIMRLWKEKKPLVTIKCLTYNHEKFIEQAMDGFLSQITDFAFEIIIHDDASKDNTASIIRKYEEKFPDIVKPIYQSENLYSKHDHSISRIIHENTNGRYVALCDGDDYWIDENKLQKQIDCMQKQPDCGLCFTNFNIFYQNKGVVHKNLLIENPEKYPSEYTLEQWILKAGYTAPMTWVYTTKLYESFERLDSLDFSFEFFAHALSESKVICLKNDVTAVYRIGHESAVHTSNPEKYYKRAKSLHDVQLKMIKKYGMPKALIDKVNKTYYNKAYILIGINYDSDEIIQAKKHCTKFLQKVFINAIKFMPIRKLFYELYEHLHK